MAEERGVEESKSRRVETTGRRPQGWGDRTHTERWFVVSYLGHVEGMTASYHVDDRVRCLREAGMEVEVVTSVCGTRPVGWGHELASRPLARSGGPALRVATPRAPLAAAVEDAAQSSPPSFPRPLLLAPEAHGQFGEHVLVVVAGGVRREALRQGAPAGRDLFDRRSAGLASRGRGDCEAMPNPVGGRNSRSPHLQHSPPAGPSPALSAGAGAHDP